MNKTSKWCSKQTNLLRKSTLWVTRHPPLILWWREFILFHALSCNIKYTTTTKNHEGRKCSTRTHTSLLEPIPTLIEVAYNPFSNSSCLFFSCICHPSPYVILPTPLQFSECCYVYFYHRDIWLSVILQKFSTKYRWSHKSKSSFFVVKKYIMSLQTQVWHML